MTPAQWERLRANKEAKSLEAAQAASIIVKMLAAHGLELDENAFLNLPNPCFHDFLRQSLKQLREAGHEEDAKTIEAMPLKPYRYMAMKTYRMDKDALQNATLVRPQ